MTQSEANAKQQHSEIEQVASAVTELSSTADNVNYNAAIADELARDANGRVEQGLALFTESIAANSRMAGSLEDAAAIVAQLKSQSEQIGKVIEVIQGSPSRPTCWRSMPPSKRPVPVKRAVVLRWWPTR